MKRLLTKAERTRQFIIEKTAPIFNKKGYVGTSMSDMTEATGLTKGSIYGNFPDKEAVAIAGFQYNTKMRTSIITSRVDQAKSITDKLLTLVEVFNSENIHKFPDGGCPLLNTGIEADDTHEAFRKAVSQELLQWKTEIAILIRKGIEVGEFRKDISIEKTSWSMIALIEGGIFVAKSTKNQKTMDMILDTMKDIILSMGNRR